MLKEKLQNLPNEAGVYQYFDKNNRLLYIGKAKVLKNRIKSYFQFTPTLQPSSKLSPRIYKMISEVTNLEYIVVPNENDALILENSLIKQLKPKYNILLRDDKTYPYIYINTNEEFPRLEITRKVIKQSGIKYFGPYSSGAKDMLDSIYEILPLVQKRNCIKGAKACLFYQMKKCLAPCEAKVSKTEYKKILDQALEYIYNKNKLLEKLNQKMEQYSQEFRFEEAMTIRDRIKTIQKSQIKSTLDFANNDNLDIFCVSQQDTKAVIVKMFIREGKLISSNHNFINITEITTKEDIYKTALVNYYSSDLPTLPNQILLYDKIVIEDELEKFLFNHYNKTIKIITPKIGKKRDIVNIAFQNAIELLKINNSTNVIYQEIKQLFQLDSIPSRFEVFDNSHIMGQATVGAIVVWDDNKFIKDDYRVYNLEAKDEYAQMKEMLSRRVLKFDINNPPDMWVLDGGATLVKLAYDIICSVGVDIPIVGIAKEKRDAKANRSKGGAKDIIYTKDDILKLPISDKRLQFIQRLRDEAHRSAINFHKKQKRKEDKQISLLEIKGIGKAKITKMLNYFGSFEEIQKASLDELEIVLNKKDAINVYEFYLSLD